MEGQRETAGSTSPSGGPTKRPSHLDRASGIATALAFATWVGLALLRVADHSGGNCGNLWDPRRAQVPADDRARAGILRDLFGWTIDGFEPDGSRACADLLNERRTLVLLAAAAAGGVGLLFGPAMLDAYRNAVPAPVSEEEQRRRAAIERQRQEELERQAKQQAAYTEQLTNLALRTGLPRDDIQAMVELGHRTHTTDEKQQRLKQLDQRFATNGYRLRITSWQDAERAAMAWMRTNGWPDAQLTGNGADGGIDVQASRCVAQVKWQTNTIAIAAVLQIAGAAAGRQALFFARQQGTRSPYSKPAAAWAKEHGVSLYGLDPAGQVHRWDDT